MMAMVKGEGMRSRSFPPGQGVLEGNQLQTCHLLYKTLLEAPAEGCVQEEGEGHDLTHYHLLR